MYRAFTSQRIINILKKHEGIHIDNVIQALEKLLREGVKTLIVQSTHLMNGFEYDYMVTELDIYKDRFDTLLVGEPFLTQMAFMGHGTEHSANAVIQDYRKRLSTGS